MIGDHVVKNVRHAGGVAASVVDDNKRGAGVPALYCARRIDRDAPRYRERS